MEYFLIPQMLEHDLVPSPYLPTAKMLEFTLPLQNATAAALHPTQFFSSEAPDLGDQALMLRVRRLPVPDLKTINKLLASCRTKQRRNGDSDDPHQGADMYADCDIPLTVASDHLLSGGSSIADNFAVGENGKNGEIVRSGEAETSDAEEESDAPVVLGQGQRRKIVARRYHWQGPAWDEH
ncbi:hypothetical protein B0H13DRAFT_2319468 [Mycena leptocephala]|nr:hypothetical protein B0H13DRAFT_2319468 [Mycena leptocephala]